MITASTRRRNFMQAANMVVTLYRAEEGAEGTYSAPFRLSAYVETNVAALRRIYGYNTECKALVILSGTEPYVTHKPQGEVPEGYTDIKAGDIIVLGDVRLPFEDMLEAGEYQLFSAISVSEHFVRNELLSVEVACG